MQGNATLREVIQILFSNNVVIGTDINDAWRNVLWCIARNGYSYVIEKGSYENRVRKQVDKLMVVIEEPGKRPLTLYARGGIPAPLQKKASTNISRNILWVLKMIVVIRKIINTLIL